MKPCFKNRRVVEVPASISWDVALKHRIYSCPDTSDFDFVWGATALILKNKPTGARVPFEVCAVENVAADGFVNFNYLSQSYRDRAQQYLANVDKTIIPAGRAHRLYFLSSEPWSAKMQALTATTTSTEWSAILSICADPDQFFQWPQVGSLLWPKCVRTETDGEHAYPQILINHLGTLGLKPDTRTNGPAILSFLSAGGKRPSLGNEGWPIHHVFDGTNGSPHAVKEGDFFTHSAGLVAAHPVAHHLAHQSELLKALLRRESFLRFGFDPLGEFSN